MKWSFASVGLIMLGLIGVAVIILFQQITTNNENDYYLLKEVTEAAMIDAIDISYYRETGNLKIVKEKFVENFTRRFAESTIFVTNDYKIKFYDIIETPPKVSVVVNTGLGEYTINGNSDEYNIANKLDAILEYTGKYTNVSSGDIHYNNPYVSKTLSIEYYAVASKNKGSSYFEKNYSLKIPDELLDPNIRDISIDSIKYVSDFVDTQGELNEALLKNELSYNDVTIDYMQFINEFAVNVNSVSGSFYNCDDRTGEYKNIYKCSGNDNYFVSLSGNTYDINKNKVILKYEVTWSYDEYEL